MSHLRKLRWGEKLERFVCLGRRHKGGTASAGQKVCGHTKGGGHTMGWWLAKRGRIECGECHHQTSVTAGTIFHRLRSPLWKGFWAMYPLSQDKKGVATLELAKQVRGCYQTAWTMLQKLREAMRTRDQP